MPKAKKEKKEKKKSTDKGKKDDKSKPDKKKKKDKKDKKKKKKALGGKIKESEAEEQSQQDTPEQSQADNEVPAVDTARRSSAFSFSKERGNLNPDVDEAESNPPATNENQEGTPAPVPEEPKAPAEDPIWDAPPRQSMTKSFSTQMGDFAPAMIPQLHDYAMNLMVLTTEEQEEIHEVLTRDQIVEKSVDEKVSMLRNELERMRVLGTNVPPNLIKNRCIACKRKLGFFQKMLVMRRQCQWCRFYMCRFCRHKENNGNWVCAVCLRHKEIHYLTGEWVSKGHQPASGSDLIRASFREKDKFQAPVVPVGNAGPRKTSVFVVETPGKKKKKSSSKSPTAKRKSTLKPPKAGRASKSKKGHKRRLDLNENVGSHSNVLDASTDDSCSSTASDTRPEQASLSRSMSPGGRAPGRKEENRRISDSNKRKPPKKTRSKRRAPGGCGLADCGHEGNQDSVDLPLGATAFTEDIGRASARTWSLNQTTNYLGRGSLDKVGSRLEYRGASALDTQRWIDQVRTAWSPRNARLDQVYLDSKCKANYTHENFNDSSHLENFPETLVWRGDDCTTVLSTKSATRSYFEQLEEVDQAPPARSAKDGAGAFCGVLPPRGTRGNISTSETDNSTFTDSSAIGKIESYKQKPIRLLDLARMAGGRHQPPGLDSDSHEHFPDQSGFLGTVSPGNAQESPSTACLAQSHHVHKLKDAQSVEKILPKSKAISQKNQESANGVYLEQPLHEINLSPIHSKENTESSSPQSDDGEIATEDSAEHKQPSAKRRKLVFGNLALIPPLRNLRAMVASVLDSNVSASSRYKHMGSRLLNRNTNKKQGKGAEKPQPRRPSTSSNTKKPQRVTIMSTSAPQKRPSSIKQPSSDNDPLKAVRSHSIVSLEKASDKETIAQLREANMVLTVAMEEMKLHRPDPTYQSCDAQTESKMRKRRCCLFPFCRFYCDYGSDY